MAVSNFLVDGTIAAIRRGDMVFQIAEYANGCWYRRLFAHTGISEQDKESHILNSEIQVLHMGRRIELEPWSGGRGIRDLRADLSGSKEELDEKTRDRIIDTGRNFYQPTPSIFVDSTDQHSCCNPAPSSSELCCYWIGNCSPNSHPLHSGAKAVYAFSCATFAHYCYSTIVGEVVDSESMPMIRDDERRQLETDMLTYGISREYLSPDPFRRLYPSYLIGAFYGGRYPFKCDDWDGLKDHSIFIPCPCVL